MRSRFWKNDPLEFAVLARLVLAEGRLFAIPRTPEHLVEYNRAQVTTLKMTQPADRRRSLVRGLDRRHLMPSSRTLLHLLAPQRRSCHRRNRFAGVSWRSAIRTSTVLSALACSLTLLTAGSAGARTYADWPGVDSLSVDHPHFHGGIDTVNIRAHFSNPDPNHSYSMSVQLQVANRALDYTWLSGWRSVSLSPGGQSTLEVAWFDPAAVPFFEYDLSAEVRFPGSTKSNLIVNGGFSSSLSGWTLVNHNPPGYGIERVTSEDGDADGEAHVYSTQYNTYGIPPEIKQTVSGVTDEAFVHLRFKPRTRDLIYGQGIAQIYVQMGAGKIVYWYSTRPKPANTATARYIQVLGSAWYNIGLTLDQIPGRTGDQVTIGARADMYSSLGYGSAEVDIYLDDVGASTDTPQASELPAGILLTGASEEWIGDVRAALRECVRDDFPNLGWAEDLVPLLPTVQWADAFQTNMCQAGVWHVVGDELMSTVAFARAITQVVAPAVELACAASGLTMIDSLGPIGNGLRRAVESSAIRALDDQLAGDTDKWESFSYRLGVLVEETLLDAGGQFRDEVTSRLLDMSIGTLLHGKSLGSFVSSDSIGISQCWVREVIPDTLSWAWIGSAPRAFDSTTPLAPQDPIVVRGRASVAGNAAMCVWHARPDGVVEVRLDDLSVSAGDVVFIALADSTSLFEFHIDRGGDGIVDQIVQTPGVFHSALSHSPMLIEAPAELPQVTIAPNPFNPRTTMRFELDESGPVHLAVFDLRGRPVKTLVDGELARGSHRFDWDGCDANGRTVASGSYFVRMVWLGQSWTGRMTLLR